MICYKLEQSSGQNTYKNMFYLISYKPDLLKLAPLPYRILNKSKDPRHLNCRLPDVTYPNCSKYLLAVFSCSDNCGWAPPRTGGRAGGGISSLSWRWPLWSPAAATATASSVQNWKQNVNRRHKIDGKIKEHRWDRVNMLTVVRGAKCSKARRDVIFLGVAQPARQLAPNSFTYDQQKKSANSYLFHLEEEIVENTLSWRSFLLFFLASPPNMTLNQLPLALHSQILFSFRFVIFSRPAYE